MVNLDDFYFFYLLRINEATKEEHRTEQIPDFVVYNIVPTEVEKITEHSAIGHAEIRNQDGDIILLINKNVFELECISTN